ncbi:unnamed protein product [Nesidiocoris tenuis]|uniref:Proline-rich transmembrane protein 3/4 domain-containing protein n=1 Tax=Nesidiocoris tenuis TaxID=355587 RepID=A0A6H5G9Y6_9HEMI|nr:unnamed protein product [Nesidiocoris tenuis]
MIKFHRKPFLRQFKKQAVQTTVVVNKCNLFVADSTIEEFDLNLTRTTLIWPSRGSWPQVNKQVKWWLMLHAYGFAISFLVLAFYAFFSILNIRSLITSRPFMSTINVFLCVLSATRAIVLFIDPYALKDVGPKFFKKKSCLSLIITLHFTCVLAVDMSLGLHVRIQLAMLAPYNNLATSVAAALVPTLLAPKLVHQKPHHGSGGNSNRGWYSNYRSWLMYETICRILEVMIAWSIASLTKQPVSPSHRSASGPYHASKQSMFIFYENTGNPPDGGGAKHFYRRFEFYTPSNFFVPPSVCGNHDGVTPIIDLSRDFDIITFS